MPAPALESQRLRLASGNEEVPGKPAMMRVLSAFAVAGLVASLWASSVAAGTSTVAAPRIACTGVTQTVDFTGTDTISNESRALSMSASISGSCNPTSGNGCSISLCGRVQVTLNDASGGSLSLSSAGTQVNTPQGTR